METAMAETTPLKIIREPKVYLVGRQVTDDEALANFMADEGVAWQTDTEVGPERLAEVAGRVCYMSYGRGRKTNKEFIGHIIEVGHGSVLEHGVWSFFVTGVSRSFTHELIRHRHFSYSQLSQRYVDESDSEFVEPDVIAGEPELHRAWCEAVNAARAAYDRLALLTLLAESGLDVCESFSPHPLTACTFGEAWEAWQGGPLIWGGIPSPYLEERTSAEEFEGYLDEVLERAAQRPIILGIVDLFMRHNDIERVRRIAERVEATPVRWQAVRPA